MPFPVVQAIGSRLSFFGPVALAQDSHSRAPPRAKIRGGIRTQHEAHRFGTKGCNVNASGLVLGGGSRAKGATKSESGTKGASTSRKGALCKQTASSRTADGHDDGALILVESRFEGQGGVGRRVDFRHVPPQHRVQLLLRAALDAS